MGILVYGLAKGDTKSYMEKLLYCGSVDRVEEVKKLASADGFHSFRTATFTQGQRPDFAGTVAI